MKTEQEIKDRIKMLAEKSDLHSLIGALMLLWVLDTEPAKLDAYVGHIEKALTEISDYVNTINEGNLCNSDAQEPVQVP